MPPPSSNVSTTDPHGGASAFTRKPSIFSNGKSKGDQAQPQSQPPSSPPSSHRVSLLPSASLSGHQRGKRSSSGINISPPRRRNPSNRHSLSTSVTDFGASIRRSASLSTRSRSPSNITTLSGPGATERTPPSSLPANGAASKSSLALSSFARRKKSVESVKSLRLQGGSSAAAPPPPDGSFPPLEKSGSNMSTSTTSVQYRQIPQRPAAQSNVSFGDAKGGIGIGMAGSAPVVPALPAGAGGTAGLQNPNVTFTHIQDTAAKRINTLDYLRKAHEGRIYWFNTLLFTPLDLKRLPSFQPPRLARRATNYLLLGFSLPQILDLNSQTPLEYLRALNALLGEFETYQQLHPPEGNASGSLSRARIPNMFKRGMQAATISGNKNRRASSATDIGFPPPSGAGGDIPEPSSAISTAPPMQFPPPSTSAATTIPSADSGFGGDTHLPSESYSLLVTPSLPFDPDFSETFATLCDVLIDVYRGVVELVNVPEKVGPGIGELFTKADARVRKILVAGIVREFEDVTRTGVKQEVGGVGRVVLGGLM